MFGGALVNNQDRIRSRLTLAGAREQLPLWTTWGVQDVGPLIHSLGCTFLTGVGRDLGFNAVAEVPAPRAGVTAALDEDVRSDALWFDRETRQVAVLVEFERYSGKQKDLRPKVASLLLAQQRWGCGDAVLLLAYWSLGFVTLPDHEDLLRVARAGFRARGGVNVPGNPRVCLLFFQFVMMMDDDRQLRLKDIIPRGGS